MIKYFIYRFPIWILIFTTLALIISTISIFWEDYNITNIWIFLLTALVFLFHLRVVDDYRDFEHDSDHYKDRELRKWKINIKTLFIVAEILIFIVIIFNYYYFWTIPIIILIIWWINNLISINYFWYWKTIEKNHMILYHFLNNITLNSFLIYLYYNVWVFKFDLYLVLLHLFFLNIMLFLIEVSRKLKAEKENKTDDKYIDKIWYKKNFLLILFMQIIIFVIINYFWIYKNIEFVSIRYVSYVFIFIVFIIFNLLHFKKRTKLFKNLTMLFALLFYLFSGGILF